MERPRYCRGRARRRATLATTFSGAAPLRQRLCPIRLAGTKFSGATRLLKGATDRVLASVALLLLSPTLLLIAVVIRIDSRRPVSFRQVRSGVGGAPFRLVKFRSMMPAAEDLLIDLTDNNESGGVLFKIRRDPRITWVGRVLRRLSLDELPQL